MNLSRTLGQLETSAQLQAVFDQDDLEDLPTLFDFFDTERTGSVNGKNVERMLFLLGYIVEQNAIKPNRLYTLDDFLNMAGRAETKDQVRIEEEKEAKKIFQMIDISCHGTVDGVHMHRFLESAGCRCTLEQATQLVSAVDRTDDDATCFGVDDLHHFLGKFGTVQMELASSDLGSPTARKKSLGAASGGAGAGGGGAEGESKGAEAGNDASGGEGEGEGEGGGEGDGEAEAGAGAEEESDDDSSDDE